MKIKDFPLSHSSVSGKAESLDALVQERARAICKFIAESHEYLLGEGEGDCESAVLALRLVADAVAALSLEIQSLAATRF